MGFGQLVGRVERSATRHRFRGRDVGLRFAHPPYACWVVERTLAWLNRNRRLAKDFEATIASAKAWLYLASVQLLIRRLARA
jgi:hypothetical protein